MSMPAPSPSMKPLMYSQTPNADITKYTTVTAISHATKPTRETARPTRKADNGEMREIAMFLPIVLLLIRLHSIRLRSIGLLLLHFLDALFALSNSLGFFHALAFNVLVDSKQLNIIGEIHQPHTHRRA